MSPPCQWHWHGTEVALTGHWHGTGMALTRHWHGTEVALIKHWHGLMTCTGMALHEHLDCTKSCSLVDLLNTDMTRSLQCNWKEALAARKTKYWGYIGLHVCIIATYIRAHVYVGFINRNVTAALPRFSIGNCLQNTTP